MLKRNTKCGELVYISKFVPKEEKKKFGIWVEAMDRMLGMYTTFLCFVSVDGTPAAKLSTSCLKDWRGIDGLLFPTSILYPYEPMDIPRCGDSILVLDRENKWKKSTLYKVLYNDNTSLAGFITEDYGFYKVAMPFKKENKHLLE